MSLFRMLFSASLILCCSAFLAAQVRIPLTDLPPGLTWSTPLDHTDGEVYALLTSDEEGTYLVRGDSAVWMSPWVYRKLTSMQEGLRLAESSDTITIYKTDSLVSADGLRLIAADVSDVRQTAGGIVSGGSSFFLGRSFTMWTPFIGGQRTPGPARADTQSIFWGDLDKLGARACTELSFGNDTFEIEKSIWNARDGRMSTINRIPSLDITYASGQVGKSIVLTIIGLQNETVQKFTEIVGDPVSVVVEGGNSILVTTRELIIFDSLGRERSHAYLPQGYTPTEAVDGEDGEIWLLDEGDDGKGRLIQVDRNFQFVASYASTDPELYLQGLALRKSQGQLPVTAINANGYAWVNVPLSNPSSAGLQATTMPGQVLAKADYPLTDTLPLGVFKRDFITINCGGISNPDLDTVYVLQDSTIWLEIAGWQEHRGRSGQWLSNWTQNYTGSPDITLPAGSFYRDSLGIKYGDRVDDPLIAEDYFLNSFGVLGEVAPGFALFERYETPFRFGVRTTNYSIRDSLGRSYIYNLLTRSTLSSFIKVKEAGFFCSSDERYTQQNRSFDRRFRIEFLPWELLRQPNDPPVVGCQRSDTITLSWPDIPNQTGEFYYNGAGQFNGVFSGLSYIHYVEDALPIDSAISQIQTTEACGDIIPGTIQITPNINYPNVLYFLNGEQSEALSNLANNQGVEMVLRDTVTGCESIRNIIIPGNTFSIRKENACFGERGQVSGYAASDTVYLEFADGTFEYSRSELIPGSYPISIRATNGCRVDTTMVIEEAPEILPLLDTVYYPTTNLYVAIANMQDTTYSYDYSWSNGIERQSTTLPGNSVHSLYTTQRGVGTFCRDTLTFRLGDGTSGLQNPLATTLRFSIDSEGSLLVFGLDELSLRHNIRQQDLRVQVHDASGRVLSAMQAFEEPMKIRRTSSHVVSPKFLSFGALGGVGIIW